MAFIPNRPSTEAPRASAARDFVAWPFVDELYDYIQFLGSGPAIATVPRPQLGTPVAVIGAGAAGMVAAYELLKAGLMPVIFEASDRIGGRNWTLPFLDGTTPSSAIAEMGAMRVPPENKVFYHYADSFGLKKGKFPDPGIVPTLLYYENQSYKWAPKQPPPGPFASIKSEFEQFVSPLLAEIWQPWEKQELAKVRLIWQRFITRFKDMSFYEGLVQGIPQWTTEDLNAFGALGMGSGGFGPLYGVGFLELLRILVNQFENEQELIVDGIGRLTDGFFQTQVTTPDGRKVSLESLKCVRFNTPVTRIEYNQLTKRPRVSWSGGSQEFAAVILATTTRAMQVLGLTTSIPQDQVNTFISPNVKRAIRNLHLMESSKLFIRTATKFWLDQKGEPLPDMPQVILTDELPRAAYCLNYPQTKNGVVLISYTWGDDSAKLLALDTAERFRVLKRTLQIIHPAFGEQLQPVGGDVQIYNVDWEAEPYYYGAFKLQYPGQDVDVQSAFYQFLSVLDGTDRGVYLAGDSVSWAGGWTEGALHTGLNAACAAALHIGATLVPTSPLSMNRDLYQYAEMGAPTHIP